MVSSFCHVLRHIPFLHLPSFLGMFTDFHYQVADITSSQSCWWQQCAACWHVPFWLMWTNTRVARRAASCNTACGSHYLSMSARYVLGVFKSSNGHSEPTGAGELRGSLTSLHSLWTSERTDFQETTEVAFYAANGQRCNAWDTADEAFSHPGLCVGRLCRFV
jgi:hypothetical protein